MNIRLSTRKALAGKDKTQKWLALQLGIRESKLSRWVNSAHLSTDKIEMMAEVFGMSVGQFISLGE